MKESILIILSLTTICFCVYQLVQVIMYDKFLKNRKEEFDKILKEATQMTLEDFKKIKPDESLKKEIEKEKKKVAKKRTTKKSEKKEEK